MKYYLEEFLSLNCAGDILNAIDKIQNPVKEISEAMALRSMLKTIILAEPNKYIVYANK